MKRVKVKKLNTVSFVKTFDISDSDVFDIVIENRGGIRIELSDVSVSYGNSSDFVVAMIDLTQEDNNSTGEGTLYLYKNSVLVWEGICLVDDNEEYVYIRENNGIYSSVMKIEDLIPTDDLLPDLSTPTTPTTPSTPSGTLDFLNVGIYSSAYDLNIFGKTFQVDIDNVSADYLDKNMIIDIEAIDQTTYQFQYNVSSSNIYYSSINKQFTFVSSVPPAGECSVTVRFEDDQGNPFGDTWTKASGCVFIPTIKTAISQTLSEAEIFFEGGVAPSLDTKANLSTYNAYIYSDSDVVVNIVPAYEKYDVQQTLTNLAPSINTTVQGGITSIAESGLSSIASNVFVDKYRYDVRYIAQSVDVPMFNGTTTNIQQPLTQNVSNMRFLNQLPRVVSVAGNDYTVEGFYPLDYYNIEVSQYVTNGMILYYSGLTNWAVFGSGSSSVSLLAIEDYGQAGTVETVHTTANGLFATQGSVSDPYDYYMSFMVDDYQNLVSLKLYLGLNGKYYDIPNSLPSSFEFYYEP